MDRRSFFTAFENDSSSSSRFTSRQGRYSKRMKVLVVTLIVAGLLLAGCDAKPKGKKRKHRPQPTVEFEPVQCGKSLSEMLGLSPDHDVMGVSNLINCYERNGYDHCKPNMDSEQAQFIMDACEDEMKQVLEEVTELTGQSPADWTEDLFSKERNARRTGTRRTQTGTQTGTGRSIPSVCRDFPTSVVSFLNSLAPIIRRAAGEVSRCFSRSRGTSDLVSCLFDFFTDFIAPRLRSGLVRCILSLFGV